MSESKETIDSRQLEHYVKEYHRRVDRHTHSVAPLPRGWLSLLLDAVERAPNAQGGVGGMVRYMLTGRNQAGFASHSGRSASMTVRLAV